MGTFHVVGNTNSLGCVLKHKAVERAFQIRECGLCVHSSGKKNLKRSAEAYQLMCKLLKILVISY